MPLDADVPEFQQLLARYLFAGDDLAREGVLMAADALARRLLPQDVSVDDLLALQAAAQGRLADAWSAAPAGSREQQGMLDLARGAAMPLMLALLLPHQIDERRRAERRWQVEHARLAAAFDQTDDQVLVFDPHGRIEYLNPAFTGATGWTLAQAQAHPDNAWQTALPDQRTQHVETVQTRADGSSFPAAWSISPVFDDEGLLLNHVAIGRDVTRQRRIDDALRQNDRLRAVATLAAGVAHDFNNLLGSIQGLTEVCQAVTEPGSLVARNLGGIHRASLRAAELVSQLLSFARERQPQRRIFDAAAWLQELQPLLAAAMPRSVALDIAVAPGLRIDGDAALLEQVLLNLARNGGQAMAVTGGRLDIRGDRWRDAEGHHWVRLQVQDTGEGIAAEVLPHIFDPFFTTKPVGEGTGLGLAAADGIVRQHHGELSAHSLPGRGATFTVLLPPAGAAQADSTGPALAPDTPAARVASWYELDADDRIVAVSPDWDAFARANGGQACLATQVLGRPLADFVAGDGNLRRLAAQVQRARRSGQVQQEVYRCDSPTERRVVDLRIEPRAGGHVRLSHRQLH